jgi:hypothetical protein
MNGALAGLAILLLGDSHMAGPGFLISSLHEDLQAQGAIVYTYGMCGASADAWLTKSAIACGKGERLNNDPVVFHHGTSEVTWQIGDLLEKHHPNLVIVEAGDAMALYGDPTLPKPWIYNQTHALVQRIKAANAACVWVGPVFGNANSPYHKDDARVREVTQFMSESVPPCAFIDSTQFAQPGQWPTTDGEHLTNAGYRAWSADITNAVVRLKQQNMLH